VSDAVRVLPYGQDAVLAEVTEPDAVIGLHEAALALPGVLEAVPGARTVLVVFDTTLTGRAAVTAGLLSAPPGRSSAATQRHVELTVRYDGPDLGAVASAIGASIEEVVALHTAPTYRVRFCGFAPGFAYLDGLSPRLHVARHVSPRAVVPLGSVAIAGEFTGVYPRTSPGGWQLIGTTETTLWDLAASPPALLTPGTSVRFVAS
jgi:KipI family sensor histidine kinase inhibitor